MYFSSPLVNYQIKKAPKVAIEEADNADKRNRAPKAAIEEADSADKRNRGSQEVNEQIEQSVVLSM